MAAKSRWRSVLPTAKSIGMTENRDETPKTRTKAAVKTTVTMKFAFADIIHRIYRRRPEWPSFAFRRYILDLNKRLFIVNNMLHQLFPTKNYYRWHNSPACTTDVYKTSLFWCIKSRTIYALYIFSIYFQVTRVDIPWGMRTSKSLDSNL